MRTITNGLAPTQVTAVQVLVYHPTLGAVNLCSIGGRSRVLALSMDYSHDSGQWTATLTLSNHAQFRAAGYSLDPGHTSDLNPSGVPLLGGYNRVTVALGKGATPAVVFDGYVGPGNVRGVEDVSGDDTLEVDLVGVLQPYADYYIDAREGRVYKDTYISAATNVLNQILVDYGFAPVIEVADDPLFYVYRYEIGDVSLLEAIQRPVASIGYLLAERYHATSATFRPTIVDPKRTNLTPDVTIGGNLRALRAEYTEANVRTAVRVVYRERTTGKQAVVDAASETARALYGIPDGAGGRRHRYMRIVEKDGSLIDTRAEAVKLADYALHDLSAPCPEAEVHIPWLCLGFEGGELVQAETPSETVLLGVTGITLNLPQGSTVGSTVLRGAINRRVGSRRYWFSRGRTDWIGRHDRDRDERTGPTPDPPSRPEAYGVWGEGASGDPVPVLHVRWSGTRSWNISGYCVRYRLADVVDSGTATGGSATTLVDSGKSWSANAHADRYVWLTVSSRNAVARQIIGNTATTLSFDAVSPAVQAGEPYEILEASGDWTYVSTDVYPYVQIQGLPEGARVICEVAAVPVSTRR